MWIIAFAAVVLLGATIIAGVVFGRPSTRNTNATLPDSSASPASPPDSQAPSAQRPSTSTKLSPAPPSASSGRRNTITTQSIPNRPNCGPTPSACGLPDATNTGVPPGVRLTSVSGDLTVTRAGTVIDGKSINGCVDVQAANVTIRRSKITCTGAYGVLERYTGGGLLIVDSEITCANTQATAVGSAGITVKRVNIHGCENGFDVDHDMSVSDSYIHDLYEGPGGHADGAQFNAGGHISFVHNTIYNPGGTSAIITSPSGNSDILLQNNILGGGAYTLYCPRDSSSNVRVLGNRVTTVFSAKGGAYGPWDSCGQVAQLQGNVWDNTLKPLPLD